MTDKKLADRLDWNEMLGFEQVLDSRDSLRADAVRIGAKTGDKPVATISSKTGSKPVDVIGTKTGGIKPRD